MIAAGRSGRAGNGAGPLYFTAGAGGDASTASNDGGAGGNFVFTGGNGGNSPGGALTGAAIGGDFEIFGGNAGIGGLGGGFNLPWRHGLHHRHWRVFTVNPGAPGDSGLTGSIILANIRGAVGIGTTSPFTLLDIATSSITGNGFKAQLSLTDNNAGANLKHWLFSSESGNLYIGTSTDLYATSTSAGLTILGGAGGGTSGFVGIGTSTPGSLLQSKE